MNPYDKARELKRAIEASDVFKKYKEQVTALEADEGAKQMMDDFRKKQFELHQKQMLGEELNEEETAKADELLRILMMNTTSASYLQAELAYAQLMNDISEILAEISVE